MPAGSKELDLGQFPDNKTIYVDCKGSTLKDLTIKKKPGQSIVFNFKQSGTVSISEYIVKLYDENGNLGTEGI